MKRTCLVFLVSACGPLYVHAAVSINVYERDGMTPFDGRPLMVGSEVAIVVSSDDADYWGGGLFVAGPDRGLARLSARDFDPNTCDWAGSHYADAGDDARVTSWENQEIWGFDLYTSDANGLPGKWFVIDYQATGSGDPNVLVYDYAKGFSDPNEFIRFSHVPSRDFNSDGVVNIGDYARLASYWLFEDCNDPNGCGRVDINTDGHIDAQDVALFADYWLWGVPRSPIEPADPDVTFSVADGIGSNEIALAVGESVTLYVNMTTRGVSVHAFHAEVDISDPNMGSIDNTPYDRNDPPGPGTARILVQPRDTFFDDWGPGQFQPEGILLGAASISSSISDGALASFVYTAITAGNVMLEPSDVLGGYDVRGEPITIHQTEAFMQATFGESTLMQDSTEPASAELSVEEMVDLLEEIWRTEGDMQTLVSEAEWRNFIDNVEQSYMSAQ